MSIEIKRSDKYVDYNISATNNRGYITIDTSDWINKPWMFYELPALKFEIYTETNGELVKYQNFTREIRTYNPVYSPLGVLNVTIDIRNVPEEFILRITPIFDNDAVAARNMLVENGIENGDIWGSDQDVPTQLFNLNLEFIECSGEYIPPTPPVPPTHEETITGVPPITFDGSTGDPLVSWTILGNGSQSGTPTPDNPVMPEFVGVRTKNLLAANGTVTINNVSVTIASGHFLIVGTTNSEISSTNTAWKALDFTLPAGTYRFKIDALNGVGFYIKNYETSAQLASRDTSFTLEAETHCYIAFYIYRNNSGEERDIMLNTGSTALPYEPYGWAEKITCAGQTVPVYLGQVQTVRKIKKLVLTGGENIRTGTGFVYVTTADTASYSTSARCICTHYPQEGTEYCINTTNQIRFYVNSDADTFKSFLSAQYATGTPVCVWYVMTEPETAIVNEPLAKIGDYCDELSSTDAGVAIPTVKGQNVLTVDTDLQPSEMTITYTKEGQ